MSGVKAIAAALVDNRSIAALDLSSNGLIKTSFRSRDNRDDDYSAVFALADALTHNQVQAERGRLSRIRANAPCLLAL